MPRDALAELGVTLEQRRALAALLAVVGEDAGPTWQPPPDWHADALCREHPDVNFHPVRGEDVRPALAVCAGCLVRADCLADALDRRDEHGIWGGTTGRMRKAMMRGARAA